MWFDIRHPLEKSVPSSNLTKSKLNAAQPGKYENGITESCASITPQTFQNIRNELENTAHKEDILSYCVLYKIYNSRVKMIWYAL